jgi:hypothetical protein
MNRRERLDLLMRPYEVIAMRQLESKAQHELADPRARDYPEDSHLWGRLLCWAYDGGNAFGLFGALHGLRCGGARLERHERTVRLLRGDWEEAGYAALRENYLLPHGQRLTRLLTDLGHWAAEREALKESESD